MKILVTGTNGLLGQKLVELAGADPDLVLIATSRGDNRLPASDSYTYEPLDVTDRDEVIRVIEHYRPDAVIHTAAMTHVDECEKHQEACQKLNVDAVRYLIEACSPYDIHLIHLSTDFIFNGEEGPLDEEANPDPLSFYGQSKLYSEQLLQKSTLPWSIARTVLVYGVAHDMSRSNIVLWVRQSLLNGKDIHVVTDQWRTPTLAEDLARGVLAIARKKALGIYNISGADLMTPYDMALKTAQVFGLDRDLIHATDGSRFSQPARRPPRTGFIIDKARRELGYEPLSFEEGLVFLKGLLD